MYIVVFEEKNQSAEGIRTFSSFVDKVAFLKYSEKHHDTLKVIADGISVEEAREITLDNNYLKLIRIAGDTSSSSVTRQSYFEAISASMQHRDLKYSVER